MSENWPESIHVRRFSYAPRRWQTLAQGPGGVPAALRSSRKNYLLLPSFLVSYVLNMLIQSRKADLVLANWAVSGALAWCLSPVHRKTIITVLRGSDAIVKQGAFVSKPVMLRVALKGSRAVVCVGKNLEKAIKNAVSSPEKVWCIPNGIDEHFFQVPFPEPADATTIIFAGSLVADKGVDILLKAVAKLGRPDLRLLIAGQGALEQELKNLAKRLGIEGQVTFQGRVKPGRDMAFVMSRSHFLVLPSHHEGRPNVVLEAMAAGRPVIGTDIDGIRELVKEGETGFLFSEGDIEGLSGAMRKLADNPELLIRMGRAARQWVSDQHLTWENTAREYIGLFKEVMASRPKQRTT